MSKRKPIDVTRTDEDYWKQVLDAEGLGMNRGTTFSEEDKAARQSEKEVQREARKKKSEGGQSRKRGPKGYHLDFTKLEAIASTRSTYTPGETSGVFQVGGFRHYGSSVPFGAGCGSKGGKKGVEMRRDFITYVGDSNNIARLEESLSRDEDGKARPEGYGPDR